MIDMRMVGSEDPNRSTENICSPMSGGGRSSQELGTIRFAQLVRSSSAVSKLLVWICQTDTRI